MNTLQVILTDSRPGWFPGDPLPVRVYWDLESDPPAIEVSLFWRTEGKGSTDTGIAQEEVIQNPGRSGSRDLVFPLPNAPHSFAGKLVSLVWAVEAIAVKSKVHAHCDFVLSPTGEVLVLGDPAEPDPPNPVTGFLSRLKPES